MKWAKEVKSPFQPPVMWVLSVMKKETGVNHTSKASMIAGCLDDIWEYEMAGIDGETGERIAPLTPDKIAEWLSAHGSYTTIYKRRRDRSKRPADKQEARYSRFLNLPPLEQRDIPEWASGFHGEVLIAAHIDHSTGKLEYRSVWRPDGGGFWHSKLDQFIAARPDYGKAVEPVRVQPAEPMFDHDNSDANAEHGVQSDSEQQPTPSIDTDPNAVHEAMVEGVGGAEVSSSKTDPQSRSESAIAEATDQNGTEAPDRERKAADLGEQQQEHVEVQAANAPVEVGSETAVSNAPIICNLPRGCRGYSGCKEQGRCMAPPVRGGVVQHGGVT